MQRMKDLKYALWQRDLGEMGELEENQALERERKLGKIWENQGKSGKIMGKSGKIRENQGKSWENQGKSWKIMENHGKSWENHGTYIKITWSYGKMDGKTHGNMGENMHQLQGLVKAVKTA